MGCESGVRVRMGESSTPPTPQPDPLPTTHPHNYMIKAAVVIIVSFLLAGCARTQLKEGGLYVNQNTCVGMDDLGVAKVRSQF